MDGYTEELLNNSYPLFTENDLAPLIESVKDKKVVMLGESTHGTAEFYEWRRVISLELLRNHGFDFIAVEGDWPSCQYVCHYIQSDEESLDPKKVLSTFTRWPTWMWANVEVLKLMNELRGINKEKSTKIGFHGLDVYSLMDSIDEVIKSLSEIDTELANQAKELYACFSSYQHDEIKYARSLFLMPEGCEEECVKALKKILAHKLNDKSKIPILFNAIQNAKIIKNAESYYRSMVSIEDKSWNVRDKHMMETLEMLLDYYGKGSKGIVWEHNTHIGDYRGTDMVLNGQVNIGGLAKQRLGDKNVSLIGFTTNQGEVIASHAWDGPVEIMSIPEARPQSLEQVIHSDIVPKLGSSNLFILLDDLEKSSALLDFKGHRAIGVVYHPSHDRRGHYVPTSLPKRYDAMVFFDKTKPLTPLNIGFDKHKFPESFPYGSRI
jgi:erythromycin esterase